MTPIYFLHIPKTAGQTIHHELVRVIGEQHLSPIRLYSQAPHATNLPQGYGLYSGHINWTDLDQQPTPRFVFTVLRDPRERLASLYLYMEKEAKALPPEMLELPENRGMKFILQSSADDYFFGGDALWQRFVRSQYDNFYCRYFSMRRFMGHAAYEAMDEAAALAAARAGMQCFDAIYPISDLRALERDIRSVLHRRIHVAGKYSNALDRPVERPRWPDLLARLEKDGSVARIEEYIRRDQSMMDTTEFPAYRAG